MSDGGLVKAEASSTSPLGLAGTVLEPPLLHASPSDAEVAPNKDNDASARYVSYSLRPIVLSSVPDLPSSKFYASKVSHDSSQVFHTSKINCPKMPRDPITFPRCILGVLHLVQVVPRIKAHYSHTHPCLRPHEVGELYKNILNEDPFLVKHSRSLGKKLGRNCVVCTASEMDKSYKT